MLTIWWAFMPIAAQFSTSWSPSKNAIFNDLIMILSYIPKKMYLSNKLTCLWEVEQVAVGTSFKAYADTHA